MAGVRSLSKGGGRYALAGEMGDDGGDGGSRNRSSREGKILDVAVVSDSVSLGLAFFAGRCVSLVSVVSLSGL